MSRRVTGRAEVMDTVAAVLDGAGTDWAWQGAAGAPERWAADDGPADLDVWCAAGRQSPDPVAALARAYPCAVIADADDPRRLRHTGVAVITATGLGVVDFTHGDLRVGPILLVPAAEVTVDPAVRRLTGTAAVADLLVRPVLRGRIPDPDRLAEARAAWASADPAPRSALARRLTEQLGAAVAADLIAAGGGARPDPGLPRRARLRLAARSLAPGAFGATWAQRRSVLPAGRSAGPLGLRTRGVVVALVGTDGAGKSTVAAMLADRLRGRGFTTAPAYFGMARGNLPGVALARRLLSVGSTAPAVPAPAPTPTASASPPAPQAAPEPTGSAAPPAPPGKAARAAASGPEGKTVAAAASGPAGQAVAAPASASVRKTAATAAGSDGEAVAADPGPDREMVAAAARGSVTGADGASASGSDRAAVTGADSAGDGDAGRNGLDHGRLRRVAAWYYAGEYGWRYLRDVLPALVRGRVVIADRWVYDLRESPWPGSAAARVAEVLVPAPDLLVLPDAPIDVIHRRKPERSRAEQREQQEHFHRLLAERPASCAEMVIDTSGSAPGDEIADLVAAVVEAAHGPRGRRLPVDDREAALRRVSAPS